MHLLGHQVVFGTAGRSAYRLFLLPTCSFPRFYPTPYFMTTEEEQNPALLRIIKVWIPFQVKPMLVVNYQ